MEALREGMLAQTDALRQLEELRVLRGWTTKSKDYKVLLKQIDATFKGGGGAEDDEARAPGVPDAAYRGGRIDFGWTAFKTGYKAKDKKEAMMLALTHPAQRDGPWKQDEPRGGKTSHGAFGTCQYHRYLLTQDEKTTRIRLVNLKNGKWDADFPSWEFEEWGEEAVDGDDPADPPSPAKKPSPPKKPTAKEKAAAAKAAAAASSKKVKRGARSDEPEEEAEEEPKGKRSRKGAK